MQRNSSNRGGVSHPPQFTPSFVLRKRLRFQAVAASAVTTLSIKSFGDLWCVATDATSAYQLASHVKLEKIEMWGPMSSSLVPVTVQVDWTGSSTLGGFGKSNRVSDTSMGATQPAHLVSRPPQGSQIAQWVQAASTNEVCRLAYPAGAIIDITYRIVVRDDASTQAVSAGTAVAGAAVGANYIRTLDSITASNLTPVGYSTI